MSKKKKELEKYVDTSISKLREENELLQHQVENLTKMVNDLQTEMQTPIQLVSESKERQEMVEEHLGAVKSVSSRITKLEENQKKISTAVELQAQYSRKSTLLLSGRAIPSFHEAEDTRIVVVQLLCDYLGMNVHPLAITACHRLRKKTIILVRFAIMDERMECYRRRFSNLNQGRLLIHESLTSEQLTVIKTLQKLHKERAASPFKSYSTNFGRIYICLRNGKSIEIVVDASEADILSLCGRGESSPGSCCGSASGDSCLRTTWGGRLPWPGQDRPSPLVGRGAGAGAGSLAPDVCFGKKIPPSLAIYHLS